MKKISYTIVPLLLMSMQLWAAPGEDSKRLLETPLSPENLTDTAVGLIIVLLLIIGLAWLVKRYVQVPGMGKGQVQVLGGVSLGPRERAVLVSVEGTRLLLGVAPGRVQTLHVLGEAEPVADDFAEQLTQVQESDQ